MSEPTDAFVARRRADWEALELLLNKLEARTVKLQDVEALDVLYRRAAADLARAQQAYAGTEVHRFLNQLCTRAYGRIYRPSTGGLQALRAFYRTTLPALVQAERRFAIASAALLFGGVLAGALAIVAEPESARLLVPPTVRDSVDQEQMWTDVLSLAPPEAATSKIATNNLTVTVAAFGGGFLAGLGTIAVLVFNGLLLGAVGAYCAQHGLLWRLLEFIAAHGFVELSAIVLCGAAGLMVADALIDPRERPRGAHLRARSRAGAQLVLGVAPFLALIGIVESYVSPAPFIPAAVKLGVGATLGAALWGYLLREATSTSRTGTASGAWRDASTRS